MYKVIQNFTQARKFYLIGEDYLAGKDVESLLSQGLIQKIEGIEPKPAEVVCEKLECEDEWVESEGAPKAKKKKR